MGLTIGYTLSIRRGLSLAAVREVIEPLQGVARDLRFETVGELIELGFDYPGAWHIRRHAKTAADARPPAAGWQFSAVPGAGSESVEIGLCRYKGVPGWRLRGWCKTQYASRHGWDHFRDCHRRVVDLLRGCEKAGMRVKVTDEGRFWGTRSEWYLYRAITKYDQMVAAFGGMLKDAAESAGERVHGPIFSDPRFEHLEAEGQAKLGSRMSEALRRLPLP
jgi:hypothetical protein